MRKSVTRKVLERGDREGDGGREKERESEGKEGGEEEKQRERIKGDILKASPNHLSLSCLQ